MSLVPGTSEHLRQWRRQRELLPELTDLLTGTCPVSAVDEFDHDLQHPVGDGAEPRTGARELAVHPAHGLLVTRRVGFEAAPQFGKGANAGQLGIHPANDRVQPLPCLVGRDGVGGERGTPHGLLAAMQRHRPPVGGYRRGDAPPGENSPCRRQGVRDGGDGLHVLIPPPCRGNDQCQRGAGDARTHYHQYEHPRFDHVKRYLRPHRSDAAASDLRGRRASIQCARCATVGASGKVLSYRV